MGLYLRGPIIGRIYASEIWGAYFREGLFLGGAYYRNFTVLFEDDHVRDCLTFSFIFDIGRFQKPALISNVFSALAYISYTETHPTR